MPSVIDLKPIMRGVESWIEAKTGEAFAWGEAPPDDEIKEDHGWGALHLIVVHFDGPQYYHPDADASIEIQVDSVGGKYDQAVHIGDAVRRSFLARTTRGTFQVDPPQIPPWKVVDRRSSMGARLQPSGERDSRVYSVVERFVLCITPV